MRKLTNLCLAIALVFLYTFTLKAQTEELPVSPNAFAAKVLFLDYALPNGLELDSFSISNGLEVAYIRNLTPFLNIGVPVKVGLANVSGHLNKRTMASVDLIVQAQYYKEDNFVVPYVLAGGGAVTENFEDLSFQFPVGLGVNLKVGKNSYLNVQGEYRISQTDMRNNIQYGLGYWVRLGGKKYNEQTRDTDGDGVLDIKDECPTVAGLPTLLGCPDADGDQVADKIDLCPDVPGPFETLGCPDTDADGIPDNEDLCPNEVGPKELNGCPDLDRDKDGVTNDMDDCPDEAGPATAKGCPDSDGDGVADKVDDCPLEAGAKDNSGCPKIDTDGDGILDESDKCPQVAGPLVLEGCPDTDGDGILDKNDKCPDEPGTPENKGCPNKDSDGDGILDANDECPNEFGSFALAGCPDGDGDGVADKDDDCPTVKGPKESKGCPNTDADGDGVPDEADLCPEVKGPYSGCPDTDGDGMHDGLDNCPATPGLVTNQGCPEIKKEEREVLEFAAQAVVFETGQATLKAESYAILDQVAEVMKKYPDYKLNIIGHTDDVGPASNNQKLSEARAKACLEYLKSRVDASRLSFEGLGESKPIADNDTEEGRELNRRVEFDLYAGKKK